MVPVRDTWSLPGPLTHSKRVDPESGEKGEGRDQAWRLAVTLVNLLVPEKVWGHGRYAASTPLSAGPSPPPATAFQQAQLGVLKIEVASNDGPSPSLVCAESRLFVGPRQAGSQ